MYLITWITTHLPTLRDGWLGWPCWLTDSGRFNRKVVTHPASSLAQDRESSPAETIIGPSLGIEWTEKTRLTDIDFADDISLLAETRDSLQESTTNLETEAKKVGLRISAQNTKTMQIGGEQAMTLLSVSQQTIQNVDRFTYLGSTLNEDGDVITDVNSAE